MNSSKKKLLILGDRFRARHKLINLGEQAKVAGLRNLLEKNLDCQILSGIWKAFPYFNLRRFRNLILKNSTQNIFQKWLDQATHFSLRSTNFEKRVSEFIDRSCLFQNSFLKKVDRKIEAKQSRGLIDTLKPYVLKNYYASQLISLIQEADIVLLQKDHLGDHTKFYLPSALFEVLLAKKYGKKVVTINQTVSLSDPLALEIASFVMKEIDLHIVREPLSRGTLLNMGIDDHKIVVSADSAFAVNIELVQDTLCCVEKNSVGIIIRGDRNVNEDTWMQIVKDIQARYGKNIYCLFTCEPHDKWVFKRLSKKCKLYRLSVTNSYSALIRIMSQLDFVITDRFHGAVFTMLANTPVIPIEAKTHKMSGLFSMFDYPIGVLDRLSEENCQALMANIEKALRNRQEIQEKISKAKHYLLSKASSAVQLISSV